jgi:hypothetical protein
MYNVTCNDSRTPSRGWYSIFSFTLSKAEDYDELKWSLRKYEDLALMRVNLCEYRDCDISDEGLVNLSGLFDFFRKHGREVILRFVYDVTGMGLMNEPSSKRIIKRHMEQVAPIIIKNADNIITVQGVFTGSWGEMHSSRYTDREDIADLVTTLFEATKGSVNIALRTPKQIRELDAVLSEIHYQNRDKLIHKIGLYDDAMLASPSDMGTFMQDKMKEELSIVRELSLHNYVGGETVSPNELNDGKAAVEGMRARCATYLNSQYDTAVLDKWKNQEYDGKISVYQYISEHLGYCLEFVGVKQSIFSKKAVVMLKNTGFAPFFGKLKMVINDKFTAEADLDVVKPGECVKFSFEKSRLTNEPAISCIRVSDGKTVSVKV